MYIYIYCTYILYHILYIINQISYIIYYILDIFISFSKDQVDELQPAPSHPRSSCFTTSSPNSLVTCFLARLVDRGMGWQGHFRILDLSLSLSLFLFFGTYNHTYMYNYILYIYMCIIIYIYCIYIILYYIILYYIILYLHFLILKDDSKLFVHEHNKREVEFANGDFGFIQAIGHSVEAGDSWASVWKTWVKHVMLLIVGDSLTVSLLHYPLVNIQKAIENDHRNSEFSH